MSSTVTLQAFLQQVVDGYLLSDLAVMAKVAPSSADGHLGFPIVSACCAGIELLGALASPNRYDKMHGARYFEGYWKSYLYPQSQRSALANPFYKLVRHGLAHAFLTKPPVIVTKHDPTRHLSMDAGVLIVDATALAADFAMSYSGKFKTALGGLPAQDRLDEMIKAWSKDVTLFQKLLAGAPAAPSGAGVLNTAGWLPSPSSLPSSSGTSIAPSGSTFISKTPGKP